MSVNRILSDPATRQETFELLRNDQLPDEVLDQIENLRFAGHLDRLIQACRVINEVGRPMLPVLAGAFVPPVLNRWIAPLETARGMLEEASRAVGRLEVDGRREFVGTGWLIEVPGHEGIVVTNRHVVLSHFGVRRGAQTAFLLQTSTRTVSVALELKGEGNPSESLRLPVLEIIRVEPDDGPDLALLRLAASPNLPRPIRLGGAVQVDQDVAVVGYPSDDENDLADDRLLRGRFGMKTLSPGQILRVQPDLFTHDASTTPGFSGAPILDLNGLAIGAHFHGEQRVENTALDANALHQCLVAAGLV
jgi:hypothetical protein